MADHARKQIRDLFVASLAGLATTQDNVFSGRRRPLPAAHAPTLLIYTSQETSRRAVAGVPPKLERTLTLHVEGRVSSAGPDDDTLDTIAAEVEAAIAAQIDFGAAKFFGGQVLNVDLQSSELAARAEGERYASGIQLTYQVTYYTVEGAPTHLA